MGAIKLEEIIKNPELLHGSSGEKDGDKCNKCGILLQSFVTGKIKSKTKGIVCEDCFWEENE